MRNKILLLAALVGTLVLAGCITMSVSTEIKADGSGSKSMIVAMDDSILAMAESFGTPTRTPRPGTTPPVAVTTTPFDPFADLSKQATKIPNATVQEYHKNKQTGVKIILPFKTLDELVALSKIELYDNFDSIKIERSDDLVTMRIQIKTQDVGQAVSTGGMPTRAPSGAAVTPTRSAAATPRPTLSPDELKMLQSMLEMSYSVTAPGKIVKYEPATAEVEGNTITWALGISQSPQELMVQWAVSAPTATPVPPTATLAPPTATPVPPTAAVPPPAATSTPAPARPSSPLPCLTPGLALMGLIAVVVFRGGWPTRKP